MLDIHNQTVYLQLGFFAKTIYAFLAAETLANLSECFQGSGLNRELPFFSGGSLDFTHTVPLN